MKYKNNDNNYRFLIVLLNAIFIVNNLIFSYKSNSIYFFENIFTINTLLYILITILSAIFIKNSNIYLSLTILLFTDIPFILKTNIQSKIAEFSFADSLILVHSFTLIILCLLLILIFYLIIKFKIKLLFFLYYLIFFYSISFVKNLASKKAVFDTSIILNKKIQNISKNYYFLLFDEYPKECILNKYTNVSKKHYPSNFLNHLGFIEFKEMYSNYNNTELSTTSFLTGMHQQKMSINKTIIALNNNVFTLQKEYKFNIISVFDKESRPNSLVSEMFFKGNDSLLKRYLIPFCLQFFRPYPNGLFTNFEIYHYKIIDKLKTITKNKQKSVSFFHFYTPHNYPLVEKQSLEKRIENANYWIIKSIEIILKNDPSAGIIIFSDHGLRLKSIPEDEWNKNIMYYKNISLDTFIIKKKGLIELTRAINF
jgi:hypothetical protein